MKIFGQLFENSCSMPCCFDISSFFKDFSSLIEQKGRSNCALKDFSIIFLFPPSSKLFMQKQVWIWDQTNLQRLFLHKSTVRFERVATHTDNLNPELLQLRKQIWEISCFQGTTWRIIFGIKVKQGIRRSWNQSIKSDFLFFLIWTKVMNVHKKKIENKTDLSVGDIFINFEDLSLLDKSYIKSKIFWARMIHKISFDTSFQGFEFFFANILVEIQGMLYRLHLDKNQFLNWFKN